MPGVTISLPVQRALGTRGCWKMSPAPVAPAAAPRRPQRSAWSLHKAVTPNAPVKLLQELIDHLSTVIGTCKA